LGFLFGKKMQKPPPPQIIHFPSTMYFQITQSTSLWKKIVFVAKAKEWTCREVIEHAISVAYHLHELGDVEIPGVPPGKRHF